MEDDVVAAEHGEAAVVMQDLEAEPVAVEADAPGDASRRQRRDRGPEPRRQKLRTSL
jgi:hypothetical protein